MSGEHGHGHAENPFAGQGAVLLDIGDDIGALVVAMPAAMLDVEIEIRPVGADVRATTRTWRWWSGRPAERAVPSLVFGELVEGSYELYEKGGGTVRLTVTVRRRHRGTWPGHRSPEV